MNIRSKQSFFRSRDFACISLLFVVALLLRFPFVAHPNMTMFDELIYKSYITRTILGEPTFDIHPPLAKLLFVNVAEHYGVPLTQNNEKAMQPFGEFPYVPLRELVALFGALLPLCVYGIGRKIGYSELASLIPALLVTFDNAFITYSRVMLPDMILLCVDAAALLFAFSAANQKGRTRMAYAALSIALLATAISIKWTALGVLLVVMVLFVRRKMWGALIAAILVPPLVYIASFLLFFQFFPLGGHMLPIFEGDKDPYNVSWITNIEVPRAGDIQSELAYLPLLHQAILRANTDAEVNRQVFRPGTPTEWPLGKSKIIFWHETDGNSMIRLTGNVPLWCIGFLLFIYECLDIVLRLMKKRKRVFDEYEFLLVLGYLINYLPFLLISRPMYLYHYFVALLFLFLLAPKILPRLRDDLVYITGRPMVSVVLTVVALATAIVCFVLLLPTTYGFTFFG